MICLDFMCGIVSDKTMKPAPLLTTKFHIPATRARLVPRPRLWQRLAEALTRERSLIVISAPAGFGKTTLLSEWLQHLSLPVAWLSLDPADNDVARFLAYLSAALQKIHPEGRERWRPPCTLSHASRSSHC